MHLPVRPDIAQKSLAFIDRKTSPDLLRDRSQSINDGSPITTSFRSLLHFFANQAYPGAKRTRPALTPEVMPRSYRHMGLRNQATPRQNVDQPFEPPRLKCHGDI